MSTSSRAGDGLSDQELQFASWWVRHGDALRKNGHRFLIAFSVLCWSYAFWVVLDTYAISYPKEQRITQTILRNQLSLQTLQEAAPQALNPSQVQMFETTGNRRDIVAQLSNANPQWWAEFSYRFNIDGTLTATRTAFILPNSQRYLTELGWSGNGRSPALVFDDIRWHRITPTAVDGDYQRFYDKRLKLTFTDVTYQQDVDYDGKKVGQTAFTLKNASGFGYWNMDLMVILYRQGIPAGITQINVRDIKPGETRPITIHWFENLDGIAKTDIQPVVNVLDQNVFLPSTRF
ncbi:MAG: hypothetical protein WCV84_04760 [Patescibacteria group bacterium]